MDEDSDIVKVTENGGVSVFVVVVVGKRLGEVGVVEMDGVIVEVTDIAGVVLGLGKEELVGVVVMKSSEGNGTSFDGICLTIIF